MFLFYKHLIIDPMETATYSDQTHFDMIFWLIMTIQMQVYKQTLYLSLGISCETQRIYLHLIEVWNIFLIV